MVAVRRRTADAWWRPKRRCRLVGIKAGVGVGRVGHLVASPKHHIEIAVATTLHHEGHSETRRAISARVWATAKFTTLGSIERKDLVNLLVRAPEACETDESHATMALCQ
jgi:hypothetical protein